MPDLRIPSTTLPRRPATSRPLHWPLPAVLAWLLAWATYLLALQAGLPPGPAAAVAAALGIALALRAQTRWRAVLIGAGFPLSLLAGGLGAQLPAWTWLMPLALLLALYPRRAWRDAPLFPTPAGALDALPSTLPLAPGARVLDAGCGLGHGLRALQRAYPDARLEGVEWSWPLALAAHLACPRARVRRGDLWTHGWAGYDLVYLFQRPESMPRALAKARSEMVRGSWLVSLEFEAAGWQPEAVLHCADGRPLWLYRLPLRPAGGADSSAATAGR